ncbi:hypothetical protein [Marinomonas sp. 2405UD68-3]|uniref:hypothetical protein n=1 Tax=Marinomonas sp. 2405UD68-3 TaxID=3391835 RepID=UPI0039C9C5D2
MILMLEEVEDSVISEMEVSYAVVFIDSGVFLFSKDKMSKEDTDMGILDLALRMLNISTEERNITCPMTSLMSLPISILTTPDSESIYA